MMGISALSFAGMKKKASTTTRAAMTICANADFSLHGNSPRMIVTMSRANWRGAALRSQQTALLVLQDI